MDIIVKDRRIELRGRMESGACVGICEGEADMRGASGIERLSVVET